MLAGSEAPGREGCAITNRDAWMDVSAFLVAQAWNEGALSSGRLGGGALDARSVAGAPPQGRQQVAPMVITGRAKK